MSFYAKNQMVWAKVKGYSWWPAIVAKSNQTKNGIVENQVLVNFVGEETHAAVSISRIVDFEENFDQFSVTKSKKLQSAIRMAQKILDGLLDIDGEKIESPKKGRKQEMEVKRHEKDRSINKPTFRKEKDDESPGNGRMTRRMREMEEKAAKEYENLLEFVPHRFTRSISRSKKIEMLTEPLIYSSRKSRDSSSRENRPTRSNGVHKRNKNRSNGGLQDTKGVRTRSMIKSLPKREAFRELASRVINKKKGALLKPTTSKLRTKMEEKKTRTRANSSIDGSLKTSTEKEDESMKEENDKSTNNAQDPSESDDFESLELNLKTSMRPRPKTRGNNKRPFEDKDNLPNLSIKQPSEDAESIVKKVKTSSATEDKTSMTSNHDMSSFPISSTKAAMAYNSLKIKKIENDLEQILNKLIAKFQQKEKLEEENEEYLMLVSITRDFEKNTFNGSELASSSIGKLFKTIQLIFTKNKDLLCLSGESVIFSLAKALHKIKDKILKFCLDNTNYMQALKLPERNEDRSQICMINLEEVKTNSLYKSNSEITIMEEEEGTNHNKNQKSIVKGDSKSATSNVFNTKNNESMHDETHKHEEKLGSCHLDKLALRKTICKKFAALLQRAYSLEKGKSQELTLLVEDKVNAFYINDINAYKGAIKGLLTLIKANKIGYEDLNNIKVTEVNEFNHFLKQKLDLVNHTVESPEPSASTIIYDKKALNDSDNKKKSKGKEETGTPRKSVRIQKKDPSPKKSDHLSNLNSKENGDEMLE